MHKNIKALGRLKKGELNNTEKEYSDYLERQKISGIVEWFKFESIKLKLADNTTYTPDFLVMLPSGELECHEVKGFWKDDARVKIKVAASMFPFKFLAVTKQSKKNGGGWSLENF